MTPFILPEVITAKQATLQLTPGTYTELVNDTWNGQDVDTDPTLAAADSAAALAAQLPADLPGASDLNTALGNLGGSIPAQGASTFASDMATAQAAQQAKTDALVTATETIPYVGELPINPAGYGLLAQPPVILTLDFGNMHINVPIAPYFLGEGGYDRLGFLEGMQNPYLVGSQGFSGNIEVDEHDYANGGATFRNYLTGTPTQLGLATVQVNWTVGASLQTYELTITMTVIP